MEQLSKCLTIDPGWNTGIAYWVGDLNPITQLIREPTKRRKIKIEPRRLSYMFRKFENIIRVYEDEITDIYIEGVQLWSMNPKSLTAAQRGDLFALSYLVGGYIAICQRHGLSVNLIYPSADKKKERQGWKGQLDAKKLAMRIQRINNKTYPEHIREAVGIGFSVMGIL
jgi:hypothetical protein